MIIDKFCFTHIRKYDARSGQLMSRGGATVAWIIHPKTLNLEVYAPALCHPTDTYDRAIGRENCMMNVDKSKTVAVFPKSLMVEIAFSQIDDNIDFSTLTPNTLNLIKDNLKSIVEKDIFSAMASNWFEELVRTAVYEYLKNMAQSSNRSDWVYG